MENEQRRRPTSAKTSKKGGKRLEALVAQQEARRREVVREKLREKLDLERRALNVVERLLEDSVAEDFLADCARFITPANYKDAIEERFIAKLCGYPICTNKLGKIPTQKYKISTKTNKVYDITERKCFCSNFCYKASKDYELQISTTPLWLRKGESPSEIKLVKKGVGGSSGEEVLLTAKRLQEEDIENPQADPPEDPRSAPQQNLSHSDGSDLEQEQEQDFVSSTVPSRHGPRVHWGDLPKRTDEDDKGERGTTERREKQRREGEMREDVIRHKSLSCKKETGTDSEKPNQLEEKILEETSSPDEPSVEEAAAKLNSCSLSETVTPPAPLPVGSAAVTQSEHTDLPLSPPCKHSYTTQSEQPPSSSTIGTNQDSTAPTSQPTGLNITQVGMSKRGATGLKELLKNHTTTAAKPDSIRTNLLECLRSTLRDWSTDETLKFLYGVDLSLCSPSADVRGEKEEEELDEDDLEDEETDVGGEGVGAGVENRPPAVAPDYATLKKETQQQQLRVREFYRGNRIDERQTVQDQNTKVPHLPLVDSNAQHLIQKRIAVEKLTRCFRNIVGPLCLTMSDISTDLNNLVKTFRFSNTNIIHKTPEWTLIAIVLLHLLSDVSLVVREALEVPTSVDYLNTLMEELGLQEQDLLKLVQLLKTQAH